MSEVQTDTQGLSERVEDGDAATRPGTTTDCPACKARGKPVKPVTIEALVTPGALARVGRREGWRFCSSPACEIAYFNAEIGEVVVKSEVRVRIGAKESAPPHPVCYCFGHTVEDVDAEVTRTGASTIAAAITEKCRQGLDRCPETNPQGSCCLGNVRAAEQAALARTAPSRPDESPRATEEAACCAEPPPGASEGDCCAREAAPTSPPTSSGAASRAGLLSSAGAVVSAVLASACCWLPLLLVAFGASAASVSGFFEQYRLAFLGGAGLLLGLGFYFAYFRAERCGPDGTCAPPNRRVQRLNRAVLWVATALVIAAGAFPRYVGAFLPGPNEPAADSTSGAATTYAISGMTCEACAVTVRAELEKLPGVARADVSFERKTATVVSRDGVAGARRRRRARGGAPSGLHRRAGARGRGAVRSVALAVHGSCPNELDHRCAENWLTAGPVTRTRRR